MNQTPTIQKALHMLAITGVFLLLFGFFFNRVVFNIGVFFTALFIIFQRAWYKSLLEDKYLLSFAFLPIVVLLADLFHSPESILKTTFFNKLMLLEMPLFIYLWKPSAQMVKLVHYCLYIFLLINTAYSLFTYLDDPALVVKNYEFAKVLSVLSFRDHIRISWLAALSVVLAFFDFRQSKEKLTRAFFLSYMIIQVAYLHILSAKTGLLCLYVSALILLFYTLFSGKNKWASWLILAGICLAPIVAYKTIPSFYYRVNYIRWDVGTALSGAEQPGLSDGARIYSLQAGMEQFKDSPFLGSGFIGIKKTTDAWYAEHKSFIIDAQKILPSSELLIFAIGGGILALIVLLVHFAIPFFSFDLWKNGFFSSIYIPAVLTFSYETHFEGQTTLFVYAFWVFWIYALNKKYIGVFR
ncbi:MAG: hypothetical protein KDC49_09300 [Saprospiraceae bacterium]|nr:hypothetical protein [Saprospiraceae bacterium]